MADAMASDGGQIASLAEFSAIPGAPSEPTLRKLIAENADFPVVKVGKNGSAYEIRVVPALQWLRAKNERETAAKRRHADEVRQVAMAFLGEDADSEAHEHGLSAEDKLKLLQAELAATKLRTMRGELIRKSSIEEALANLIVTDRRRRETFGARLAKRVDLTREQIAQIDALMEFDLRSFAADMETIADCGTESDDAGPNGGDPAL